jgi:hypothetical protein
VDLAPGRLRLAAALIATLLPSPCAAADVELAPFVGFQFGGSVDSAADAVRFELDSGVDYGATLDIEVAEGGGWSSCSRTRRARSRAASTSTA